MATAGLSSCKNGNGGGLGAVDPPPPPLQCNAVNLGQTLRAAADIKADSVVVTITEVSGTGVWRQPRIATATGADIGRVTTPADGSRDPFVVAFPFGNATSLSITFTFEGELRDYTGKSCVFTRNFIVTASRTAVTVAQVSLDSLPLPARQRAEIVVVAQRGRTISLEARTPYRDSHQRAWAVTGGLLSDASSQYVTWTLPEAAGIYAAELALDYGDDGIAFDTLMLEVLPESSS